VGNLRTSPVVFLDFPTKSPMTRGAINHKLGSGKTIRRGTKTRKEIKMNSSFWSTLIVIIVWGIAEAILPFILTVIIAWLTGIQGESVSVLPALFIVVALGVAVIIITHLYIYFLAIALGIVINVIIWTKVTH
jgi:cation transporter-like permease